MIAIDTNVLVRLLVDDSPAQTEKVLALVSNNDIFIVKTVLLETEWVLRYSYEFDRKQIHFSFSRLLRMKNTSFEDIRSIRKALAWYREEKLDFSDALHLASSHSTIQFMSFDKTFVKKAEGFKEIKIELL